MVKNIVFDIGDVILNFDFHRVLDKYTDDPNKKKFVLNILTTPDWMGFAQIDYGYLTIDEAIANVKSRTHHQEDELVDYVFRHYYLYSYFNDRVLNLIKKLKRKYRIYLLSNINEYTFQFIKNSDLFKLVDGYVLSYQVHQVKPDKAIYQNLIHKYNLLASESLFIDDNFENIKTAEDLGFHVIHVLPNNYDDLLSKLIEKNIEV